MWIEFKRGGTSLDPFDDDNKNGPEASAKTRTDVRGQLRAYAYNAMIYGHRTAIYGLLINGPEFRGMRYDRSGLIVTKKMNYVAQPFDFMEYLARFGSLDPVAQGLDPTATLLMEGSPEYMLMDKYGEELETDMDYLEGTVIPAYTPPVPAPPPPAPPSTSPSLAVSEAQPTGTFGPTRITRQQTRLASAFAGDPTPAAPHQEPAPAPAHQGSNVSAVEAVDDSANPRVFKYVREQFRKSLEDGWPRYRLEVGADKRTFLVGKPIFCSMSVLGRGTRAYVALDEKSRRFVFLKDSWRPFYLDVREEGYYLKELAGGEGCQYVPRVLCEGDVPGQVAFTARYHQEKYPPPTQTTTEDKQTGTLSSSHQASSTQPSTQSSTTGRKRSRPDTDNPAGEEATSSFRKYTHYRIVLEDVCLPFISFTSVRQLVRLMLDCITGTYQTVDRPAPILTFPSSP